MDKVIPRLLSFPPQPPPTAPLDEAEYDKQIRELAKQLALISAKSFTQDVNGGSVFSIFDASINTLPYLYALLAHINADKGKSEIFSSATLWEHVEKFIDTFDPVQVRYVGHQWRSLLEELLLVAEKTEDEGQSSKALGLVQTAMIRLDPSTSTFTSVHLGLVKSCLALKLPEHCIHILNNDIFHFPVKSENNKHIPRPCGKHLSSSTYMTTASGFSKELTYRDHLQYFLYGAMVYIIRSEWARAFLLLELVLTSPVSGNTASMIQVEAYKKWILVGILLNSTPPSLPRGVSQPTNKCLNSLCKPYVALAEAFKEKSPRQIKGEYKAGLEDKIWTRENNHGLVKLVVASHRRFQILSFSAIYSSVPVNTLAQHISEQQTPNPEDPVEVEKAIRDEISSGSIHACLVKGKDGTELLKFLSPDGKVPRSEAEQAARLKVSVDRVDKLNLHVKDAQRRLELTKDYILAAKKRRAKEDSQRNMDGMDDTAGGLSLSSTMDEDTLADL